jgi:uncharacterized protein
MAAEPSSSSSALTELIKAIAIELVDHPDEVEVVEIPGENNTVIELRVAKDDIGKVIGKEGRTAQSMRTILTAASTKLGKRAHLDIVD